MNQCLQADIIESFNADEMIEKSKKEDITLKQLERLLFNYWS